MIFCDGVSAPVPLLRLAGPVRSGLSFKERVVSCVCISACFSLLFFVFKINMYYDVSQDFDDMECTNREDEVFL